MEVISEENSENVQNEDQFMKGEKEIPIGDLDEDLNDENLSQPTNEELAETEIDGEEASKPEFSVEDLQDTSRTLDKQQEKIDKQSKELKFLMGLCHEMQARNEEQGENVLKSGEEKRKLQQDIQDLEEQLEEGEAARQKPRTSTDWPRCTGIHLMTIPVVLDRKLLPK